MSVPRDAPLLGGLMLLWILSISATVYLAQAERFAGQPHRRGRGRPGVRTTPPPLRVVHATVPNTALFPGSASHGAVHQAHCSVAVVR